MLIPKGSGKYLSAQTMEENDNYTVMRSILKTGKIFETLISI
jgi:hypothetical protein